MHQGSVLCQSLRDGLRAVVPKSVRGEVEGLQDAEFRGEDVVDGLCASEGDFVGRQVEDSQSIVLEAELFDGVYGIAVQLIFSEGQFLQSSVDLQHLCEMDSALLSDALVFRCIEGQRP